MINKLRKPKTAKPLLEGPIMYADKGKMFYGCGAYVGTTRLDGKSVTNFDEDAESWLGDCKSRGRSLSR